MTTDDAGYDAGYDAEVDADDYAVATAQDTPPSRGFQSDADFQAQKASYTAKFAHGDIYHTLPSQLPELVLPDINNEVDSGGGRATPEKPKLTKKHNQLITAAAGELYWFRRYDDLIKMIDWIGQSFEADGKLSEALRRWEAMCRAKMDGYGTVITSN